MAIEFICTGCERRLSVPEEYAGKKASCPACQRVLVVPSAEPLAPLISATPPASAPVAGVSPRSEDEPAAGVTATGSVGGAPAEPVPTPNSSASFSPPPVAPSKVAPAPTPAIAPNSPANSTPAAGPVQPAAASVAGPWLLRTPERIVYGPVPREELEAWVRQGRVTSDCELRTEAELTWRSADTVFPALAPWNPHKPLTRSTRPTAPVVVNTAPNRRTPPAGDLAAGGASATPSEPSVAGESSAPGDSAAALTPDRGILILTLGLVGVFSFCPIFSVAAWVMGTSDLQEMRAGRMDVRGLGSTMWGRRLGLAIAFVWCGLAVLGTIWGLLMAAS